MTEKIDDGKNNVSIPEGIIESFKGLEDGVKVEVTIEGETDGGK